MKTGVIIYIAGKLPDGWDLDAINIQHRLGVQGDSVEVVLSNVSSDDIHFAWWKLIAKGMQIVICKLAIFDSLKDLQLTGKELRLCG